MPAVSPFLAPAPFPGPAAARPERGGRVCRPPDRRGAGPRSRGRDLRHLSYYFRPLFLLRCKALRPSSGAVATRCGVVGSPSIALAAEANAQAC